MPRLPCLIVLRLAEPIHAITCLPKKDKTSRALPNQNRTRLATNLPYLPYLAAPSLTMPFLNEPRLADPNLT